jgi:hypothetical protein
MEGGADVLSRAGETQEINTERGRAVPVLPSFREEESWRTRALSWSTAPSHCSSTTHCRSSREEEEEGGSV